MNDQTLKIGQPSKIYDIQVNEKSIQFDQPQVTGKQILEKAKVLPLECHWLYQKLKGCDFTRISLEETVDLSDPGIEKFITKEPEVYNYKVDNEPETTDKKILTPAEILNLAGLSPKERFLIQLLPAGGKVDYAFEMDVPIKMQCPEMTFITGGWVEQVDVEEYGKICKEVPPAHSYKIKVDKNYHLVRGPLVTAKQLIALENNQPADRYDVYAFFSNQPKPQKLDSAKPFDLRQRCLVRFVLQPKEQKDGRENRNDFTLPEVDMEFLSGIGLRWETLKSNGLWLIICDYPIPEGYTVAVVDVALMIPPNYPAAEIDMVYFHPQLQKTSGRPIPATTPQPIDGRTFQRWSRHRQPGEWRPGVDDVSTHLALVANWLITELNR